jgi:hypothetical protein
MLMAIHPRGFEPLTFGSVDRVSIHAHLTWLPSTTLHKRLAPVEISAHRRAKKPRFLEKPSVLLAETLAPP